LAVTGAVKIIRLGVGGVQADLSRQARHSQQRAQMHSRYRPPPGPPDGDRGNCGI